MSNKQLKPNDDYIMIDMSKLNQTLADLHKRVAFLEESNDKLTLAVQKFKDKQSTDIVKQQLDEKISQLNLSVANFNSKIMGHEEKIKTANESIVKINDLLEKYKIDGKKDDDLKKGGVFDTYITEKYEKKITEEIEKLNTAYDTKIYDLENKLEQANQFKNDSNTIINKGSMSPDKMPSTKNLPSFIKLEPNSGSELHQYAVFLQSELDTLKQMIENGAQNSLDPSVRFAEQVITYNERISKLETLFMTLADQHEDNTTIVQTCLSNFKYLQKAFNDRLKIKIKLEGLDSIPEPVEELSSTNALGTLYPKKKDPPKPRLSSMLLIREPVASPDFFASITTPQIQINSTNNPTPNISSLNVQNSITNSLAIQNSLPPQQNNSANFYANRDGMSKIEQSLRSITMILSEKVDKKEVESALNDIKAAFAQIESKISEIQQAATLNEKEQNSIKATVDTMAKDHAATTDKIVSLETSITTIHTDIGELEKKITTKVESAELLLCRQLISKVGLKVEKMFDMLGYEEEAQNDMNGIGQTIKASIESLEIKLSQLEMGGLTPMDTVEEKKETPAKIDKQDSPLKSENKNEKYPEETKKQEQAPMPILSTAKIDISIRSKVLMHDKEINEIKNTLNQLFSKKESKNGAEENLEYFDIKSNNFTQRK